MKSKLFSIILIISICFTVLPIDVSARNINISITNSKYNTTTACWDFTIQSNTKSKIYYSFKDSEVLNYKCESIKSGQVVSVPSSLINDSFNTLKLFTLDKKNNIKDKMYYRVDIIARNTYMKDLNNLCNSIYNQEDSQYIKARKLYTWIGKNKTYKYDGLTNHEYGAFYGISSACSGFSRLYVDMCSIAGIKCEYVSDEIVDYKYKEWHSWNHIHLDDKIYFVDPTWSGVCFENKVDYSHFCNNGIVNHIVTEKYDLSSTLYDNYNQYFD
ncbi:transglutaminase domain-containing protein [Anaeromicropila herbilytica]|uniref:Transglutaminase-like domain-containing protein n=1 Tax=Anaeromicropila herbilytica TaxID=2785025 RepID=A0A7R7ICX6_9FIRM|nr:transglutaminase domain-containing protein [Anaeromicropila herbilytica]BCN30409.1 hypothetical protein bsdtb5_17040 [Anaeromicropila herbilytica]